MQIRQKNASLWTEEEREAVLHFEEHVHAQGSLLASNRERAKNMTIGLRKEDLWVIKVLKS